MTSLQSGKKSSPMSNKDKLDNNVKGIKKIDADGTTAEVDYSPNATLKVSNIALVNSAHEQKDNQSKSTSSESEGDAKNSNNSIDKPKQQSLFLSSSSKEYKDNENVSTKTKAKPIKEGEKDTNKIPNFNNSINSHMIGINKYDINQINKSHPGPNGVNTNFTTDIGMDSSVTSSAWGSGSYQQLNITNFGGFLNQSSDSSAPSGLSYPYNHNNSHSINRQAHGHDVALKAGSDITPENLNNSMSSSGSNSRIMPQNLSITSNDKRNYNNNNNDDFDSNNSDKQTTRHYGGMGMIIGADATSDYLNLGSWNGDNLIKFTDSVSTVSGRKESTNNVHNGIAKNLGNHALVGNMKKSLNMYGMVMNDPNVSSFDNQHQSSPMSYPSPSVIEGKLQELDSPKKAEKYKNRKQRTRKSNEDEPLDSSKPLLQSESPKGKKRVKLQETATKEDTKSKSSKKQKTQDKSKSENITKETKESSILKRKGTVASTNSTAVSTKTTTAGQELDQGGPVDIKKHPWTDEEDVRLTKLVEEFGAKDWGKIASKLRYRNGKQCHQRWNYFLNPDVKRGEWTEAEDQSILYHQRLIGNKWAKIALLLPGRTGHAVKNRFNQIMNGSSKNNFNSKTASSNGKSKNFNEIRPQIKSLLPDTDTTQNGKWPLVDSGSHAVDGAGNIPRKGKKKKKRAEAISNSMNKMDQNNYINKHPKDAGKMEIDFARHVNDLQRQGMNPNQSIPLHMVPLSSISRLQQVGAAPSSFSDIPSHHHDPNNLQHMTKYPFPPPFLNSVSNTHSFSQSYSPYNSHSRGSTRNSKYHRPPSTSDDLTGEIMLKDIDTPMPLEDCVPPPPSSQSVNSPFHNFNNDLGYTHLDDNYLMSKGKYHHKSHQGNAMQGQYTTQRNRAHSLLPLDDESAVSVEGDQRRLGPLQDEISLNDECLIQNHQRFTNSVTSVGVHQNISHQIHPRPPVHPGMSSAGNIGHIVVRNSANTIHNAIKKREKTKSSKTQLHPTMVHLANTTGQSPSVDSPYFNDDSTLIHLMQQQNNLKVDVDGDGDTGVDVGEGAFTNHSRDDTDRLAAYQLSK